MSQTLHRLLQPEGWIAPKGYANGIAARGTMIFVAGQIGCNDKFIIVDDDLVAQVRQALRNVVAVLNAGDAEPAHVVRMTWYVTDIADYRANLGPIGHAYREVMGKRFPTMSLVQVSALVEPRAVVEIEATAVVPDSHS